MLEMRKDFKDTVGRVLTLLLCCFGASSCSSVSLKSGDALKTIYSGRVVELRNKYAKGLDEEIRLANSDLTGARRNRLLNDLIFLVDSNYAFWAKNAYNAKAFSDFGADFSATTLSTLSGIVTGGGVQGAKSILSFISAGITSTKSQFSKDVLQDQSLNAVLAKTRSLRTVQLIPLANGMYDKKSKERLAPRPLSEYPVEQGLIDLAAYFHAGTFVSAIESISDQAAVERVKAQDKIDTEIKAIPSLETGLGDKTNK